MTPHDDASRPEDQPGEIAQEFLVRALEDAAVAELEMPHIVVCRDAETGVVSYSGPFATGIAALVFAEREAEADRALNDGVPLQFGVAALYPTAR